MGSAPDQVMQELEAALRMVTKRVYAAAARQSSTGGHRIDRAGYGLLVTIDERGEIRLSDLAAVVELDISTVSRQVRQLADDGLLQRRPDPVDGRASLLNLSAEGRKVLAGVRTARVDLIAHAVRDWRASECTELVRLLQRLTDGLTPADSRPSAPVRAAATPNRSTRPKRSTPPSRTTVKGST